VRYLVLAAACSLAVLTYVQRQGFVAGTPYIKNDLGLDDQQMGYLASVWLIAYGVFQVPGGLLGDRLGARHLLTLLVLGWSLLVGVVALTAALPPGGWLVFACLVVLRFLFGAFQAGGFPGLARVVADWMPSRQRGSAQGTIWTFSRLGGALAPLLVVWLITQVFGQPATWQGPTHLTLQTLGAQGTAPAGAPVGVMAQVLGAVGVMQSPAWALSDWATPCWVLAGLGLLWCAFFWPWFRNRPEEMSSANAAECGLIAAGRPPGAGGKSPVPWSVFPRSRNVWALCLMYGFTGFAGNFITSLLPIYLRDHLHLGDTTTARLTGLPLACGVISCVLGGVLSDWLIRRTGSRKWGRRLVGVTTLLLAALACLLPIWAGNVWMLAVAFGAWMFFNDGMLGPGWASCADVGERYAGTLSGAMNMTGSLVGAVGMALAGRLLRRGEYDLMFLIFAVSYVLAALCWLAVDVTKPLVPQTESR
jgi:sugar phosphate permease